jgi:toxin FitB
LDTNALSALVKPQEPRVELWFSNELSNCFTSVIVIGEIERGIRAMQVRRRNRYLDWLSDLEHDFSDKVLPISRRTVSEWSKLCQRLKMLGKQMQVLDSLIAATAIEHRLTIVTHDEGFKSRGLKVFDPFQV